MQPRARRGRDRAGGEKKHQNAGRGGVQSESNGRGHAVLSIWGTVFVQRLGPTALKGKRNASRQPWRRRPPP